MCFLFVGVMSRPVLMSWSRKGDMMRTGVVDGVSFQFKRGIRLSCHQKAQKVQKIQGACVSTIIRVCDQAAGK